MMYFSLISVLALAAMAAATSVSIDVGKDGKIVFTPNTTNVDVGDTVEFKFYNGSGPHSVVKGIYDSPCQPATDAFFSDYIQGNSIGNQTYTIAINSTAPIWFYCSAHKHCQNGMVGVINPPANATLSDYANAAKSAAANIAPTSSGGASNISTTASIGGASKTGSEAGGGASATSSATPASSSAASGAEKGMGVEAVLGMAVAGVAALFV